MKKSLVSALFALSLVSVPVWAQEAPPTNPIPTTTDDGNFSKKVLAHFGSKLLVVPCIEVQASPFDGYYNVVLEGNESGMTWTVKDVIAVDKEDCGGGDEDESLESLLKSLGFGNLADLIGGDDDEGDDNSDDEDGDDDPNGIEGVVSNIVNNAVNRVSLR